MISIVVPCYNEEIAIGMFYQELMRVLEAMKWAGTEIFISLNW